MNCATKPAFAAKTDFIDKMSLLILRDLLKIQTGPKIPAYRLAPYFSITYRQSWRNIRVENNYAWAWLA